MKATAVLSGDGEITLHGVQDAVPWWSFTKTVLATAVLRLVDQRALDLDDCVPNQPFSIRQLLRHESGLPDYGSLGRYHDDVAAGKQPWPVEELLNAVKAHHLRFRPGTDWAYSNVGYLRVAQFIENTLTMPLDAALSTLVFEPCGLATARLAVSPDDLTDVEMGSTNRYHPGWVYHGLVVGTVAEAAKLLHCILSDRLLQPDTLAQMLQPRALPEHRSDADPDPAYGLGLMVTATDPQSHPIGHTGEGPGSRIGVYAKGKRTAAVWTALPSELDAQSEARRLVA